MHQVVVTLVVLNLNLAPVVVVLHNFQHATTDFHGSMKVSQILDHLINFLSYRDLSTG